LDVRRRGRKWDHGIAAAAVIGDAIWERDPCAERGLLDRVFAGPILDHVSASVWIGPSDSDGVQRARGGKVNEDPLGMERIVFACVWLREVRIAFPIRIQVAIGESRIADHIGAVIVSDAAMR
jgi:hypothetical protein